MFHLMAVHGVDIGEISYETDRMAVHRPRQTPSPRPKP